MYAAQYGRSAGAVLSVVTKNGTNAFHGSLYEFHRNKALDALPYFFTGTKDDLPNYLFNQYGGTIGGPIKKNQSFFFLSLERFYEAKPSQQLVGFVPTALEAAGDVSQTINPFSGQPVVLTNPFPAPTGGSGDRSMLERSGSSHAAARSTTPCPGGHRC
jgi:hypothetical protein